MVDWPVGVRNWGVLHAQASSQVMHTQHEQVLPKACVAASPESSKVKLDVRHNTPASWRAASMLAVLSLPHAFLTAMQMRHKWC